MSTKRFLNLYVLICLFPAWLLSSNIVLDDKLLYFLPYIFFIIVFIIYFNKEQESKFKLIFLSIITIFAIDQNLSLYRNLIKPNFVFLNNNLPNIYFADLLLILFLFIFVLTIFFLLKIKSVKIFFSFLLVLFIFKVYQIVIEPIEIINFDKTNKIEAKSISDNKTLIIILDEMSGIDSSEKNFKYGDVFFQTIKNFAINYNLNLYTKTFSISDNTGTSVSSILNFNAREINEETRKKFIKKTISTYNEYDLIKNSFFEKFKNISVIQNIHINYCNQKNVKKCYQINPYIKNTNFLKGFKDNLLTRFFSHWYLDGSSIARLFFKVGRILNLTDSILEPESHKIFLPLIFSKLENDIDENKFDLIFAHILAPHTPYGFSKDCKYDGKKSTFNSYMKISEKYIQHNIERICMIKFISHFLHNIKMKPQYKNLDIFIISDHGSRITPKEKFSSILLTKISNSNFEIINNKISMHNELKKIFLENYR